MQKGNRFQSIDAFRGATVLAMILVNNPGSWAHVYRPLLHAPWHGLTPTDLIFPFFIFSVGISIHLAYRNYAENGLQEPILWKILKRTALIFLLGILLHLYPRFAFDTVRIPGVLQRISIVFLCCSLLYFFMSPKKLFALFCFILLSYFVMMNFIPVPSFGLANLEPTTNLAAWLDNHLLHGHLWSQTKVWDPEGILSTWPAIATGISGMLTGYVLTNNKQTPSQHLQFLSLAGIICLGAGLFWSYFFPINKSLWTSSYVLVSTGFALLIVNIFHWLIDAKGIVRWSSIFQWYGMNALFVFLASGIAAKTLSRINITNSSGTQTSAWSYVYETILLKWFSPVNASLAFAMLWVLFFGCILYFFNRKKIIIKI
jgi:predicted acyltransferase